MTDYEMIVMRDASNDLCRALKIISEIDINLGLIDMPHTQVIQGCASALSAIAEDLYSKSQEKTQ